MTLIPLPTLKSKATSIMYNTVSTDEMHPHANEGDQFGQRSRARLSDQSHYIGKFESSNRVQAQ
jgi:hypothetical protein